ncbi:MAG: ABC transporter permease [Myxococcota bacterium]
MLQRFIRAAVPSLVALAVALAVGAVMVLAIGQSPLQVGADALQATLGTGYGLGQVIFKATPLILTGLAVAIPYAAGLFNIGAEGQLLVGALASAVVAHLLRDAGGMVAFSGAVLAAAITGAAAGAVPAALKAWRGVHEVISTIMLNFILAALCGYLLHAHLADESGSHTPELPAEALFGRLSAVVPSWTGSLASTSALLAVLLAAVLQAVMFRSVLGYQLRVSGAGPLAARHAGIHAGLMTVVSFSLGGALAGLAGAHFVLGARRFFEDGLSAGEGFLGIAVALMARGHPLAVIPGALVFGGLGQAGLSLGAKVPRETIMVLQALVVLALAATGTTPRGRLERRPQEDANA